MEAAQDSILFGMPEDPEMFLVALSTVQDYVVQLKKQIADRRKTGAWFVAVHLAPQFDFLKGCFPEEVVFVDEWNPMRGEWDLVYKFDAEVAYRLSLPTEQHATTSFGILVGADPPHLPNLDWLKHAIGFNDAILLLPFEGQSELEDIVHSHRPEVEVMTREPDDEKDVKEIWKTLMDAQVVVGMRSFSTYMAAALDKTVLELYPDDRHAKWLPKWTGKYQMVYGDNFPVEFIWRALEGLLERYPICQDQTT